MVGIPVAELLFFGLRALAKLGYMKKNLARESLLHESRNFAVLYIS